MTSKQIALSLFTTMFLGAIGATAADFPIAMDSLASPVPASQWQGTQQWSGSYFGGHLGYGMGSSTNSWSATLASPRFPDGDINFNGAIGGVHAGYQLQFDRLVAGVEADLSLASIKGNDSQFAGQVNEIDISATGTLRGRFGVAHENVLVYGTAGLAVAGFAKNDVTGGFYATPQLATGFVAGAGVEVALTEHLRARAEYQYIRLGEVSTGVVIGGGYMHYAENPSLHVARAGLSYAF